jgi:hypothetical protein
MEARMSAYEGTETTDAGIELWRVQLATGEVRAMTLDALDDAFQSGVVSESTPVLAPGATAWTRLGEAAGLDAPAAPEPSALPSLAPMAVSLAESTGSATPYAARTHGGVDLDDLDELALKPKRGRVFAGLALAALVVAGLGFAATRAGSVDGAAAESARRAPAPQAPAAGAAPPPAVDLNQAFPAKPLTEEQKAKLAEVDKAREARDAAKRKDRPAGPSRPSARHEKNAPFVNGGSKFDPLNGAL